MINTIIQGRMLVFVQQVNVLLYYVRKLPLVGEKIPYRLYGETDIKKAIGIIPVVFSVIGAFVGTFLYFLLMIKLPANWIQGFWQKEGLFVVQNPLNAFFHTHLAKSKRAGCNSLSRETAVQERL